MAITRRSVASKIRRTLSRNFIPSARAFTVYDDDVYITSYPKSGNTWVRFLVANMVWRAGDTDFGNINLRVPDIYSAPDRVMTRFPRPRYFKSHEYFDPRYPTTLYIVRDPRSICTSYYHYRLHRQWLDPTTNLYDFTQQWVRGQIDSYGNWSDNVLSWIRMRRDDPRFCLIRYEDLKNQQAASLRRIAAFLGLDLDETELEAVAKASSFESMRKSEMLTGGRFRDNLGSARGSFFVRSGKVDGWRTELDPSSRDLIEAHFGETLLELGYTLDTP